MPGKPEEYLERAAEVEATAKRASNPAIRQAATELAKALREMARLLTDGSGPSDAKASS